MRNVPLIGQPYIYTGEDDDYHKVGETYYVVETGNHWIKDYGFVVWVSSEEDRFTKDADYCVSMSLEVFHKNFWKC